jgi:hypothetical protein
MFPERFVFEALSMSVLWMYYADEAAGIFSGVFCAGGDDSGKCSVSSEWRAVVEGFGLQSSTTLDLGIDSPGDGTSGFRMAKSVVGRF